MGREHVSLLKTNSLGKQQLELSTHRWSGCVPWSCSKIVYQLAPSKLFCTVYSTCTSESGGIRKQWITSPRKQWVLIPLRPQCSFVCKVQEWIKEYNNEGKLRGTLRVSGKQSSLLPFGPVINDYYGVITTQLKWLFIKNLSQKRTVDTLVWLSKHWPWIGLSMQNSNWTLSFFYLQGQFAPIRGNYSPEFRSLVSSGNFLIVFLFLKFPLLPTFPSIWLI